MKRWLVLVFIVASPLCFAGDFGAIVDQKLVLGEGTLFPGKAQYAVSLVPWFAAPLWDSADLYLSGALTALYENEDFYVLPEIHRFELIWNFSPDLRLEAGRVPFQDSLSWIMSGLFDGACAGWNIAGGRLSGGLFYTGLLYKKTAAIYMSMKDRWEYYDNEFYFASRRLVAGINWEKHGLLNNGFSFSAVALFQFDLNDDSYARIHSQYLGAKIGAPLGDMFNAEFGAVAELAEETGIDPYIAFAASAALQWMLPTAMHDILSFGGRFSSGAWTDQAGPFIPITAEAQGKVLKPMLSGIALVEADYTARIHQMLSGTLSAAYYFKTDRYSYSLNNADMGTDSPLLGAEIYLCLGWLPFSDLLLSVGGGVFLPKTGKVFKDDTGLIYRVELTASVSF